MTEPARRQQPSRPAPWWHRLLPSALSGLRLILAAIFPFLNQPASAVAVALAALSDGLDGWLARKLGTVTWWGARLDATADKVFGITVLVTLVLREQLAAWQMGLLVARDVVVVALAVLLLVQHQWPRLRRQVPSPAGKATTACLFLLVFSVLAWPQGESMHQALFLLTAALSVLAGLDYLWRFIRDGREGTAMRPG